MRRWAFLLVAVGALGCGTAEAAAPPTDLPGLTRVTSVQQIGSGQTTTWVFPAGAPTDPTKPPMTQCYYGDNPQAGAVAAGALVPTGTSPRCLLTFSNGQWSLQLQGGSVGAYAFFVAIY
jgi:hypothetical protein